MGSLRALLALSVVFAHSFGFVFVGGVNAVRVFYMISGFLISYVLTEGKRYDSKANFYVSRYIRLFPLYFVVALGAFVWSLFTNNVAFFGVIDQSVPLLKILLIFSNIFIFFQDWVFFLPAIFPKNSLVAPPLYSGLLVPQAWSLGLELCFYLIAPYLLVRRWLVITVFFASLSLRGIFWSMGLADVDPWSYRFFPLELSLFLAGALSHQIMLGFYNRLNKSAVLAGKYIGTGILFIFCAGYFMISLEESIKLCLLLALSFMFLPFSFMFQRESRLDQRIGDLSYPIYIVHLLIISIFAHFRSYFGGIDQLAFSLLCVSATVLISWLSVIYLLDPVDRYRSRFRDGKLSAGKNEESRKLNMEKLL